MDNFEDGLVDTMRSLRAELAALQARKSLSTSEDQISPYSMILPSSSPITSDYGWRWHPILRESRRHEGVDFDAPYNAPVWAAHSGMSFKRLPIQQRVRTLHSHQTMGTASQLFTLTSTVDKCVQVRGFNRANSSAKLVPLVFQLVHIYISKFV